MGSNRLDVLMIFGEAARCNGVRADRQGHTLGEESEATTIRPFCAW
jgi:hypothetical protein